MNGPRYVYLFIIRTTWVPLRIVGTANTGEIILTYYDMCGGLYIIYHDQKNNNQTKIEIQGIANYNVKTIWNITLFRRSHRKCYIVVVETREREFVFPNKFCLICIFFVLIINKEFRREFILMLCFLINCFN